MIGVLSGPGTELEGILASLGVKELQGCGCKKMKLKMDMWGVDGCREHRAEIVDWLSSNAKQYSLKAKFNAGIKAIFSAPYVSATDPYGSMIDEAIRRTEERHGNVLALPATNS